MHKCTSTCTRNAVKISWAGKGSDCYATPLNARGQIGYLRYVIICCQMLVTLGSSFQDGQKDLKDRHPDHFYGYLNLIHREMVAIKIMLSP